MKVYEFLSIIKHGNPAKGHISFTISVKPEKIIIDKKNVSVNPIQLLGLISYQFEKSHEAVLIIADRNGIDLNKYKTPINAIQNSIRGKIVNNLKKTITEYIGQTKKTPNH